jgi:hypothetical protein
MAATDILDDIGGPSLTEVLIEPPPPGRAMAEISQADLTKLSALHFQPITARRCEVERTQAKVLADIKEAAAMSSSDFYYSFPVKKRGGGTDYIEGISIDGAMACLQAYRNAEIDCRPIDIGHSWIFLARFIDHERGTSVIRPFMQRKVGGSQLGGIDEGRRMEIAFSIGASKASRNVIANAIRPYTNFCFEEAKQDLVKRVGLKLPEAKAKALARLEEFGVVVHRVELVFGRAVADWTAREVAGLVTQIRSVQQGLTTPNDVWPLPAPPEPRRSDDIAAQTPRPAQPSEGQEPSPGSEAEAHPPDDGEPTAPQPSTSASASPEDHVRNWSLPPNLVGQDAILKALGELLSMTRTNADVDALLAQNAERLSKITGQKQQQWRADVRSRRELIAAGKAE